MKKGNGDHAERGSFLTGGGPSLRADIWPAWGEGKKGGRKKGGAFPTPSPRRLRLINFLSSNKGVCFFAGGILVPIQMHLCLSHLLARLK